MATPESSPGSTPDSESAAPGGAFPATHWSQFAALRAGDSTARLDALNFLIQRYWKPVYCYLRRRGCGEEDGKDLVQDFFAACLRTDFFAQADPALGRFRNFLLGSLQHFLANAQRAAPARKRRPRKASLPLTIWPVATVAALTRWTARHRRPCSIAPGWPT